MRIVLLLLLLLAPAWAETTGKITEENIEVSYPVFADSPGLSALCKQVAESQVADFKRERAQFEAEGLHSAAPLSLDFGYTVEWDQNDLRVVMFRGYLYLGGAHGMPLLETVAYDLAENKRLTLGDFFRPDSGYLKLISDYCRKELSGGEMSDDEWIARGAGPEAENFTLFYPTEKGLAIVFAPYQVAPYAAGIPEVVVPYSEFNNLLVRRF